MWLCFKNSCKARGKVLTTLSIDDIKTRHRMNDTVLKSTRDFPSWTNNVKLYPKVIEYLYKNNCIEALEFYPNRFFYDKVKNRVVFASFEGYNTIKLATGRGLNAEFPKWFKYVALPGEVFTAECIDSKVVNAPVVIVEDTASACSASRVAIGVALCGTSYQLPQLLQQLNGRQDIIICLDPDAQLKALKLQKDLAGAGRFKSVRVVQTKDDLKTYSKDSLHNLLYGQ